MKANASCSGSGWSDGAAARRTFQFSESGTWPAVATKSKYANTVPAIASAAARLTASDRPAAITLTQPTHVRYGRTATATLAATSGGPIRNRIIIGLKLKT